MRPCTAAATALLLCVFCSLAAPQTGDTKELYAKVGDSVVLSPDLSSVKETITSIAWNHDGHLAFLMEGGDSDSYRQFVGKASLNVTTAVLTLTGLTGDFSGTYEVDINSKRISSTVLKVISPVSKPTVTVGKCDETSCLLSCDGDFTAQDLVVWRIAGLGDTEPGSTNQLNITKERDADYTEFSCVVGNHFGEESSDPIPNPLSKAPEKPEEGQKWMTGLTVFICSLTVLVVVALVHRWKAGFWFYDTESMPWEADFWRRPETAGEDQAANGRASSNAGSNGNTAAREQSRHEEDGLMAETAIP